MTLRRLGKWWRRWSRDGRGVAAVEFALTAPVLIVAFLGTYEGFQAAAAYRKLSSTTTEMANVVSQYTTMSASDVATVTGASAQIMAPYATSNLSIVLSEITTDTKSNATVTWSQAYNGGAALTAGSSFTLPTSLKTASTSYMLVQTSYAWAPLVSGGPVGSIDMTDQMYTMPRQSSSIPYTG
jgi:Flp pilus assembly protein TadG